MCIVNDRTSYLSRFVFADMFEVLYKIRLETVNFGINIISIL